MPQAVTRRRVVLLVVLGLLAGLLGMHALGLHALAAPGGSASAHHAVVTPASDHHAAAAGAATHDTTAHAAHPASAVWTCADCEPAHDALAACVLALLSVVLLLLRPTVWGRLQALLATRPRIWPALARPAPPSLLTLCISRR